MYYALKIPDNIEAICLAGGRVNRTVRYIISGSTRRFIFIKYIKI